MAVQNGGSLDILKAVVTTGSTQMAQARPKTRANPSAQSSRGETGSMTIGGLAEVTETKIETIRYYERAGVLPRAERSLAGYRRYTKDDVRRLLFIRRARDLGFSLDHVRELAGLADDPRRSCAEIDRLAGVHLAEVEKKIAQLTALRRELRRLLVQCEQGEVSNCLIVDALTKDRHHG